MLQRLRDYFPKWFIAFLLSLFGLLTLGSVLYSPYHSRSKDARKVLVKVNNKKINRLQLEQAYESIKSHQANSEDSTQLTPEEEGIARASILRNLVSIEVLKQSAYKDGYRAPLQDVLKIIKNIPDFQVDGVFSPKRFAAFLAATGYNRSVLLKELSQNYCLTQPADAIRSSAFVFPKEVSQAVRLANQERDFSYLELPVQHFMPAPETLSPEEVRAYYDQHLTQFRLPEQVSIEYIEVNRSEQLSETAEGNISKEAEDKAAQVFQSTIDRLKQLSTSHPTSLKKAAEELNIPLQSTDLFDRRGGVTDITRHPAVLDAAFSATLRQGHNSALIRLNSNQVVALRVKEYQPLRLSTFETVEPTVRQQLCLQKATEKVEAYGKKLIDQIKENASDSVALPSYAHWHKVDNATRTNENIPFWLKNAAFGMPHRGKGPHVQGFLLPNGHYIIVRLTKVRYGQYSQLKDEQRESYYNALLTEAGQLDYLQYGQAKEKRTHITYSLPTA